MTGSGEDLPRASVIVPTYRSWDRLALCLSALAAQTYPGDRIEIIVVNNDPDDPKPAGLDLPPNARLMTEAKKGSYAARNAGLAMATGDILLFTDADCIPNPDWCLNAARTLLASPGRGRFGGEIDIDIPGAPRNAAEFYETIYAFPQEKYAQAGWSPTANTGAWREVFEATGPFEDRFYSGGDKRWGLAADQGGFPITFAPDAIVRHPPRTTDEILRKRRRIGGADMAARIERSGRAAQVLPYAIRLVRRLLPPTKAARLVFGRRDVPRGLKLRTYLFIWRMRIDMELARGKVLLFGAEPENR